MSTKQTIRVDIYRIVSDAIEIGADVGWNRAHKHTDTPEPGHIKEKICDAIMEELCNYIKFSEDEE